jgi:hypothetical protein
MAPRERLLDMACSARVLFVTRAEVNELYILSQTLAAGEGKSLACLDGFDRISPLLEDDKSPFFGFFHGKAGELNCALKLYYCMQHVNFCRALKPVSYD